MNLRAQNNARMAREKRLAKFIEVLRNHVGDRTEILIREVLQIGLSEDREKLFREALASLQLPLPTPPPLPTDGHWKNKGTKSFS